MSHVEPHAYGCTCDGCQRMIKALNSEAFTDGELEQLAIQTPRCALAPRRYDGQGGAMNYLAIAGQLRIELARIDHAIASLEALRDGTPAPARLRSTRGRKPNTMTQAEREQVAARMRRYWASQRKGGRA